MSLTASCVAMLRVAQLLYEPGLGDGSRWSSLAASIVGGEALSLKREPLGPLPNPDAQVLSRLAGFPSLAPIVSLDIEESDRFSGATGLALTWGVLKSTTSSTMALPLCANGVKVSRCLASYHLRRLMHACRRFAVWWTARLA
jgi:hypothetical protein